MSVRVRARNEIATDKVAETTNIFDFTTEKIQAKIIIAFFLFLGTSGSRTPDDDLESSQFEPPREISSPQPSNENLAEDRSTVIKESANLIMSRSSSSYSVAPSFSSDIPDSLLPDLSDNVGSDKVKSSKDAGLPQEVSKMTDLRTWSCSAESKDRSRPQTLALVKRNSDLPGRVQRSEDFNTGSFKTGMKSSNSDTSLNKDPYAIEEELTLITKAKDAENMIESSLNDDLASAQEVDDRETTNVIRSSNHDEGVSPVEGGARQKTVSTQVLVSPVQSPTKPDLPSPVKTPPPVSKKPPRTPTKKAKEFVPAAKSSPEEVQSGADVPGGESRELIVPVMTALQERRPSTPDCSTAKGSKSDTKEKEERANKSGEKDLASGADDKKTEVKALSRSSYTTRVSVKDRKQLYERNRTAGAELGRKQSSELFTPNTVASRKQLFERGERAGYKRVDEISTRKARSDSGSGSSSASSSPKVVREGVNGTEETSNSSPVSGSPKFRRKRMTDSGDTRNAEDVSQRSSEKTKPVEQVKNPEPRRRRKNGNPEKSDLPPSLVVDNGDETRCDDLDSLKLDLHENEKETLTTRNIEIPFEEHLNERHTSERPRRSPNNSPRSSRASARSPFPEDSVDESREPQFV